MKERLYRIWCGMKQRCHGPKSKATRYYGDKGVSVCSEWRWNFKAFKQWATSHGYADDLTIDRIDSNGNYEPSNCRWITWSENSRRARLNVGNAEEALKARLNTMPESVRARCEILLAIKAALPFMSAEQKGFFRGYAAAMTDRQDEREREKKEERETA